MIEIKNQTFDEERALYNLQNAVVENCRFEGEADGESALKESRNITVSGCSFKLRYPLWHTENFTLLDSEMSETARAAIWYAENGVIKRSTLNGIKALRECSHVKLENVLALSPEFGWKCRDIEILDSKIESEYMLFDSKNITAKNLEMNGKYSFQYIENLKIEDSVLNTKDAFWHTKNATVSNSVLNGEYLGWYSENLTLINCKISGTQPLCYCKGLKLIDCTMENCDLSFERSEVEATINGHITSVKNPISGKIIAGSIGEIINDGTVLTKNVEIIEQKS